MQDFPRSLVEFDRPMATEAVRREYVFGLRWPEGFLCHRCRGQAAYGIADCKRVEAL